METKETGEIVETYGDTFKYKKVCRDRERMEETKETVETTGDTCKYKIVWRVRERLKETKETIIETMETSNMERKRLKRLGRLWRPVEIHVWRN